MTSPLFTDPTAAANASLSAQATASATSLTSALGGAAATLVAALTGTGGLTASLASLATGTAGLSGATTPPPNYVAVTPVNAPGGQFVTGVNADGTLNFGS